MAISYLSHAAITKSSRIEPPGCAINFTPLCLARSILSGIGTIHLQAVLSGLLVKLVMATASRYFLWTEFIIQVK